MSAQIEPAPQHAPQGAARRSALLVSLVYAAFGTIWILASDTLLALLIRDAANLSRLQTFKGWLFIAITALLLYALIRHRDKRLATTANENNAGFSRGLPAMITLAMAMMSVLAIFNSAYNVWEERRELLNEGEREAQNLVQILEAQTAGMINAVDLTLKSAVQTLQTNRARSPSQDLHFVEQMSSSLASLPFVRSILVIDEGGRRIYDTNTLPTSRLDYSDREYFPVHRDAPQTGLHVSQPMLGRTPGVWFFTFSRRLSHRDGRFAGVVVATVESRQIERFYRSISVGPTGAVSLVRRDGIMLVRSPELDGTIGKNLSDSTLFAQKLPFSEIGTYQATSAIDTVPRIFSYRALPGFPLVVVIGLDRGGVLAQWRSHVLIHVFTAAAFLLIVSWLGYLTIRELRRREALTIALQTSETRLRKVLDDMMEGCQIIGFDWRYRYVNDASMQHGRVAREKLLGRTMMEVYPGLESTDIFATLRRCMEERVTQSLQTRFEFGDGNFAWFEVRAQPADEGILVLSIDITSRKLAEENLQHLNEELEARVSTRTSELAAANKELEAFGYSVSHDLRAPLRHLDGFARLALEGAGSVDEKTRGYIEKIVKASGRMATLIDDLLVLSRAGRAELHLAPVDLNALVMGVQNECMNDVAEREIDWHIDELPAVLGDETLLRQVFMNLVGNAIKFTRNSQPAIIEITASSTVHDEVTITVRDNGAGFDMRYADKLYGVFQRLHHEREFEGTGIGLAIVQRILERHHGRTWAESTLGKGATFYLTLKTP